jgi:hypothetical protein
MYQSNPHQGMSSDVSYPPVDVDSRDIHYAPKIASASSLSPSQKTRLHVWKPIGGTMVERSPLPTP